MIQKIRNGDLSTLSKAISKIENGIDNKLLSELYPYTGAAHRIGITGPPGAGKSTLANQLVHILRKLHMRVGVIVVDPSSPFTGGALLGDRIRMADHYSDSEVYIRSMASRGSQGGLAEKTQHVGDILDAAKFDFIIFETVGVGQIELDVIQTTDTVVVVLVPESGDDIQMMKAGLMEIGDIFVINKSDRDGADKLEVAIRQIFSLSLLSKSNWETQIIKTIATQNFGLNELSSTISKHKEYLNKNDIKQEKLKTRYIKQVREIINMKFSKEFWKANKLKKLNKIVQDNRKEWPPPLELAKLLLKDE